MHLLWFSTPSRVTTWRPLLVGPALAAAVACHDLAGLAGTQPLPSGTPDPSVYHTAAGALSLYQTTLAAFQYSNGTVGSIGGGGADTLSGAFVDFVLSSGLLTDELQAGDLGCVGVLCVPSVVDSVDARQLGKQDNSLTYQLYAELQGIRNDATVAASALAVYDTAAPPALRGHLYALAGYAELFLADLYCSGVPLSTITFNGTSSFTYAAGSTTLQIYHDALMKFDTALALSGDSARILNLARIGKGRALLALDSFPQAAQSVASVPDNFSYQFLVDWTGGFSAAGGTLFNPASSKVSYTVADQEGRIGLPFISSGDPRTRSQVEGSNQFGVSRYIPLKYGGATPGILPIAVADGIEARLIQAEAALQAGDVSGWLIQLNRARMLAAPHLPSLTDPGVLLSGAAANAVRVNLLFQERAFDLFLTGHRQGDMRRLIRQYHRAADLVYPTGAYPLQQVGAYGNAITVQVPSNESVNPLFHGCISTGA